MKASSKFTLIELLIVLSIIGILSTLLIPSLGKAREKARQVVCLSNMHQLGAATSVYGTDNSNSLPVYRRGKSHGAWGFDKRGLERALASTMGETVSSSGQTAVGNPIFMCPSAPVTFDKETSKYIWIPGDNKGHRTNTYEGLYYHYRRTSVNSQQANPDNRLLKRTLYEFPDALPFQWCSRRQAPAWTELDETGWNNTLVGASWHARGDRGPRPVLFLDGHASILKAFKYTSHKNQEILKSGSTWLVQNLLEHKLDKF
ncbi:MAG: DUF1559 domain-containing protein [Lentisphaeraceae bacterium]|nr:DUF1559 domain-containing protein [Lentisphaeraceae bacterium]